MTPSSPKPREPMDTTRRTMTHLPPHIISMIEKEAEEFAPYKIKPTINICAANEGYLNGATAWAEKCMELVEALEKANSALRNVEGLSRRIPELRGFHPFEEAIAKFNGGEK